MEPQEEKFNELVRQWEAENPGASDVDSPPVPSDDFDESGIQKAAAVGQPNEMTLPEMDLSPPPPGAEPVRMHPPEPLRIKPATVGAGSAGGLPRGGVGASPSFPAKPTASSEPLDWNELSDRLKQANINTEVARSSEHYLENAANPGQYRSRTDFGGEMQAAKMPLELAQARQGLERGQLANDVTRSKMGASAAEKDPNSLQSQKARESFRTFFGGSVPLPSGFDNWSAADIKSFAGTGDMAKILAAKNAAADDAAKAKAGQEKAAAAATALENSRKAFAPQLKALGIDPTRASEDDIKLAVQIGHNNATESQAKAQYALAAKGEGRKEGDYAALGQSIPFAGTELKYTGTGTPRSDDVDKAQSTAALYGAAISGMNDLERAMGDFAKNPSPETRDAVVAKTQAVSGHLNTAAGQGAMSKDEKAEMEKALGVNILTPGGVSAIVDKLTGDDAKAASDMTRRLQAVRQSTRAAALGKLEPYHFAPAGGDTVQMKFPNGRTIPVPKADVDEAKSKYKAVISSE